MPFRAGVLLLGFYFSGSKLTKVRANVKLQLDANYKVGGQRSARQVSIYAGSIDPSCVRLLRS